MKRQVFLRYILISLLSIVVSISYGQKKALVILAHPNLAQSEVNKAFVSKIGAIDGVTIDDLYDKYSDFKIDITEEQELLKANDIIIFQFPLYWFSSPALLRKWQDEVMTSAFALGDNNQMKGKKFMVVVSVGGSESNYRHGGDMDITMDEVLTPFEAFAHLIEMEYVTPFVTYAVPNPVILNIPMSEEQKIERHQLIEAQAVKLVDLFTSLLVDQE